MFGSKNVEGMSIIDVFPTLIARLGDTLSPDTIAYHIAIGVVVRWGGKRVILALMMRFFMSGIF